MHDHSQTYINDDIHNDIDIYMNTNIDEDMRTDENNEPHVEWNARCMASYIYIYGYIHIYIYVNETTRVDVELLIDGYIYI